VATDRPREHGGVTLGHKLHKQYQGAGGVCGPQRGPLTGGRNAAHSDELGGHYWGRQRL